MAGILAYKIYPSSPKINLKKMQESLLKAHAMDVKAVSLVPLYMSPRYADGHDVADYMSIDRRFGTLDDFDEFVRYAHALGLKVLMDLPIEQTSVNHEWFMDRPDYYCWSNRGVPELFWEYEPQHGGYYLQIFRETAHLNWFPHGELNHELVDEFRNIVKFWTEEHGLDGFHLDFLQFNKYFYADKSELEGLFIDERVDIVVDGVFENRKDIILTVANHVKY